MLPQEKVNPIPPPLAVHGIGIIRTWIQEKDELEADVVCAVEFQSTELGGQVIEGLRHGWYSEKGQREQLELLSVGQCGLVGKLVVHPLMDLVHYQHLGPRVLQQPHLIVHL